jgi:hypothetical protein
MLVLTVVAALGSAEPRASAAGVNAGSLTVASASGAPITTGNATTSFNLVPPSTAACSGDTATGQYRVNSYIVPASVDPSTLTWNSAGPVPVGQGATLRQPLFSATNSPLVNAATALNTGAISAALGSPFSVSTFQDAGGPTFLPDGNYNVGLACTLAGAEDKFWNVVLNFTANAGTLQFTVPVAGPSTTTSTTTTVRPGGTTSSTTTTTVRTTSTTSATAVLSAAAGGGGGGGNVLVSTGSSPTRLVVCALLLLAFGRMAILFGRPIKVISARS